MTDGLEHHPAAEHELHRPAQLARRRRGERQCVHGNSLPPKPEPRNFEMTRTFSFGRPNICASTLALVDHALRRLVQRQRRAVPDRDRRVQLDRVVGLGRRDVGLVELDRRGVESAVGVAALALQRASGRTS